MNIVEKIRKSKINQRIIKSDKLDKFLNGVFWFFIFLLVVAVLFCLICFWIR